MAGTMIKPNVRAAKWRPNDSYRKLENMRVKKTREQTYHSMTAPDIQQTPQVDQDGGSNSRECKQTDHLASQSACQEHTSRD
jgi:hypothetical protein